MESPLATICRACMETGKWPLYSLSVAANRKLFMAATSIPLPTDKSNPLQICCKCYKKCKELLKFQKMCKKNEPHIQKMLHDPSEVHMQMEGIALVLDRADPLENHKDSTPKAEEGEDSAEDSDPAESDSDADEIDNNHEKIVNLNGDINCPVCPDAFKDYEQRKFWRHFLAKHKTKTPNCTLCDHTAKNVYYLLEHIMDVHLNCRFSCHECEFVSPFVRMIRRHWLHVHPQLASCCTVCQRRYSSKRLLREHMITKHTKVLPCPVCKRELTGRTYHSHVKKHGLDGQFECDVCHKKFRQKRNMQTHKKDHFPDSNKFLCPACGDSFSTKRKLEAHQMKTHTSQSDRPFQCSVPDCNKAYTYEHQLSAHTLLHTNATPFSCSICSTTFRYKHGLKRHMQSVHPLNK